MPSYTREEILEKLQEGSCEILFQKKDGSIRHMKCTLNPKLAPQIQETRIINASQEQEIKPVLPIWDLEKMQWRSFRLDSVLYFNKEGEPLL